MVSYSVCIVIVSVAFTSGNFSFLPNLYALDMLLFASFVCVIKLSYFTYKLVQIGCLTY